MEKDVYTPLSNLVREITIRTKQQADERLAELGLNAAQGRMIGYIYGHQEEGVIQKDLAEVFQRRSASISSMLRGLEEKGYIERVRPAGNERQKNLFVREKGVRLIDEFNANFLAVEESLKAGLTPQEVETLIALLTKVRNHLL